jgi:hypothetical protein
MAILLAVVMQYTHFSGNYQLHLAISLKVKSSSSKRVLFGKETFYFRWHGEVWLLKGGAL